MGIIGFEFTTIDAKLDPEVSAKHLNSDVNLSITPKITRIEKKDIYLKEIKNVIAIHFTFSIGYSPEFGHITFGGQVLYQSPQSGKMLDQWEKKKELDNEITTEVLNVIFRRCLTRAIDISNELRLPPPLQFPKVELKKDQKNPYVG